MQLYYNFGCETTAFSLLFYFLFDDVMVLSGALGQFLRHLYN